MAPPAAPAAPPIAPPRDRTAGRRLAPPAAALRAGLVRERAGTRRRRARPRPGRPPASGCSGTAPATARRSPQAPSASTPSEARARGRGQAGSDVRCTDRSGNRQILPRQDGRAGWTRQARRDGLTAAGRAGNADRVVRRQSSGSIETYVRHRGEVSGRRRRPAGQSIQHRRPLHHRQHQQSRSDLQATAGQADPRHPGGDGRRRPPQPDADVVRLRRRQGAGQRRLASQEGRSGSAPRRR